MTVGEGRTVIKVRTRVGSSFERTSFSTGRTSILRIPGARRAAYRVTVGAGRMAIKVTTRVGSSVGRTPFSTRGTAIMGIMGARRAT